MKHLCWLSGYSRGKIRQIILRELVKQPPIKENLGQYSHVLFDGKFLFGRKYSLALILDVLTNKPIACKIVKAESKKHIQPWFDELKSNGFNPISVTTDGNQSIIYSFSQTWPSIIIQRCLFHIHLQVLSWLRVKPKYESTQALKSLIGSITTIQTKVQSELFKHQFLGLWNRYRPEITGFQSTHPVEGDAIRAYSLILNALDNCFHYLDDPNIAPTTSALEGYFKQIQRFKGFSHNGLTKEHLFSAIAWKVFFDSE